MNIDELKGKSDDELKELLSGLKKELFNLRFQQASGELNNTARFREVKKDVARIMTYQNQQKQAA